MSEPHEKIEFADDISEVLSASDKELRKYLNGEERSILKNLRWFDDLRYHSNLRLRIADTAKYKTPEDCRLAEQAARRVLNDLLRNIRNLLETIAILRMKLTQRLQVATRNPTLGDRIREVADEFDKNLHENGRLWYLLSFECFDAEEEMKNQPELIVDGEVVPCPTIKAQAHSVFETTRTLRMICLSLEEFALRFIK
jgi:hypothetical protein